MNQIVPPADSHRVPVMIYRAQDSAEAWALASLLNDRQIQAHVMDDNAGVSVGMATFDVSTLPTLWCDQADADSAQEIIADWTYQLDAASQMDAASQVHTTNAAAPSLQSSTAKHGVRSWRVMGIAALVAGFPTVGLSLQDQFPIAAFAIAAIYLLGMTALVVVAARRTRAVT